MAEEMLKAGQPIVAYDPTGAWWGLKSSADGKQPGFPVVIFGGEHADVPLEETAGETIAATIVEKRIPAILDCSLLRKGARVRFMTTFCETLYHRNREPLHLFLDEAQTVAPQNIRAMPEASRLLGAVEDIILQGRRRGLGLTAIGPRPAIINANIRSACQTLIAMRIGSGKLDRKAIEEWIEAHGDPEQAKEMMREIAALPKGDGWIWNPAEGIFQRVHFRQRETFDSSATPKLGRKVITPQRMAKVDLDSLGEAIKATVERAKADDPRELRRKIVDLEKQINGLKFKGATSTGDQSSDRPAKETKVVVEVPVISEKQLARLEKLWESSKKRLDDLASQIGQIRDSITRFQAKKPTPAVNVGSNATIGRQHPGVTIPTKSRPESSQSSGYPTLGKCERAILQVLSSHGPCDSGKLTLLSGYRYSGGFKNSLSDLRTAGLIVGANTAVMEITEAGEAAGPFDSLPTGAALRDYWLNHRSFGVCERSILQALIGEYPGGVNAETLCAITGYQYSGGFKNSLSCLRTAGLLVGKNTETMRASDTLFE